MSKLRTVTRALSHSEEWREILQAACAVSGVDCTEQLSFRATYDLADKITVDPDTLIVDIAGVGDEDVLEAVQAHVPEPEPEPEPEFEPEPEPEMEE